MNTRKITREIELPTSPERLFAILHTPSAIRQWWSAARAMVIAEEGGLWMAAWGEHEDDPDYITAATIKVFDPPRRLLLTDFKYHAKSGALPFKLESSTAFTVEARPNGSLLRVVQDGFPADSIADEFYAGCEVGWKNTFEGIKQYFGG
jgi:uncharacterized protein YndB with AHSA1/START domain